MPAHLSNATSDSGAVWPLVLAIPVGLALLLAASFALDRRRSRQAGAMPFRTWTALVAATMSLGAAAIHVAVIEDHFREYPPFGVAFLLLALFQAAWAAAVVLTRSDGWSRALRVGGIAVNAGALVVWAASRFVGLPFGPEAGSLEPVGSMDLAAGALEIGLIVELAWLLGWGWRRPRSALPPSRAATVLVSSVIAVVLVTSAAFATVGEGDHHSGEGDAVPGTERAHVDAHASHEEVSNASDLPFAPFPTYPDLARPRSIEPRPVGAAPVRPIATPREPAASPTAGQTQRPARTPAPTPRPTRTATPTIPVAAGTIEFGRSLDANGEIVGATNRFREGETAVWIAHFREAPNASEILKLIVQVLPDGREFEHWREVIPVADPASTRLDAEAELSLYAHGGSGNYQLRYYRGDELLAAGTFELFP